MNISAETYDMYFQHGLPDEQAVARHWSGERYNEDLAALGVSNPALTDRDVAQIRFPYLQASRYLHGELHSIEVGNVQPNEPLQEVLVGTPYEDWNRAAAVMRISGDVHDVVYKNIDANPHGGNAWPAQVVRLVDGVANWKVDVANGERLYRTFLTDKGRHPAEFLTRMTANLFELPEGGSLDHKTGGGNEFDSALVGMQFIKKHAMEQQERPMDATDAVAIAAIVAATIPFRANAKADAQGTTEGFMERLGRRVYSALLDIDYDSKTAYRVTNAITAMGVCVANRDTGPFTRPNNAPALTHGARLLKTEEVILDGRYALREPATTMSGLTRMARVLYWAPGLYHKIIRGLIPPDFIGKFVVPFDEEGNLRGLDHSYPPQDVHAQATRYANENVEISSDFFALHEVGIAAGRCLLRATGELDSEVPGGVNSRVVIPTMMPKGENARQLLEEGGTPLLLYQELAEGRNQATIQGITQRSPLSAAVLAAGGLEQAKELSDLIQTHWDQATAAGEPDPYFDSARADEFRSALRHRVGRRGYNAILDILILAADFCNRPDRIVKLEKLKEEENDA